MLRPTPFMQAPWTLSRLNQEGSKGNSNAFVLIKTILYQYALEQLQICLTARSIPKIARWPCSMSGRRTWSSSSARRVSSCTVVLSKSVSRPRLAILFAFCRALSTAVLQVWVISPGAKSDGNAVTGWFLRTLPFPVSWSPSSGLELLRPPPSRNNAHNRNPRIFTWCSPR